MFLYLWHPTYTCLDSSFHDISWKQLCSYTFLIFSQVFHFPNTPVSFLPPRLRQKYSCRFNQRSLYYQILWLFLKMFWCLSPFSTLLPGFLPTFLATPSQAPLLNLIFSSRNVGSLWGSFLGLLLSSHYISTLNASSVSLSSKTHVLMTAKFISGLQASRYEPQLQAVRSKAKEQMEQHYERWVSLISFVITSNQGWILEKLAKL